MSGSIKDLIVRILVDDAEINKFTKAGPKALEFGNVLNKAATAGAVGLAGLTFGAVEAGKAAAEAEQSESALQFALNKFPATADTNAAKLMALNTQLAEKTKFDRDAYASGQAVLAQYGLTGEQIEKLTPLLGDYAAKTGQDIPSAAAALGKSLLGQGRALKAVGINFKDTHDLGGNYGELMDGLTSKVAGFAQKQGQTATGENAIFQNSLHELMVELGQYVLPALVNVTKAGVSMMTWMKDNKSIVLALAGGIGTIATGILLLAAGMKIWAAVQAIQTASQWANDAAWLASPITWIILAIIVAIGLLVAAGIWLYNNWGAVTKWIGEAWNNVLGWFKSVGDAISKWWNDFWNGIADWARKTFGPVIDFVVNYFKNMQLGFQIIGAAISKWWNDLWSGIGSFFSNIWNGLQGIVKGAWNGIVGFIEGGVNGAISLINGIIRGIDNVGGAIGIHLNLIPNVKIPRLATGGITLGPQLAVVGDNPGGREAVIPLNDPRASDLLGGGKSGPTDLSDATIDKLGQAIARYSRNESRKGTAA